MGLVEGFEPKGEKSFRDYCAELFSPKYFFHTLSSSSPSYMRSTSEMKDIPKFYFLTKPMTGIVRTIPSALAFILAYVALKREFLLEASNIEELMGVFKGGIYASAVTNSLTGLWEFRKYKKEKRDVENNIEIYSNNLRATSSTKKIIKRGLPKRDWGHFNESDLENFMGSIPFETDSDENSEDYRGPPKL